MITQYFVLFGSVIFLAVVVFSDLLKELLIRNSDYWEAMSVVPLILLASFFLGIYHNLSVWYKVTDQTHYGAYISLLGAAITLSVNYLFIPTMGYYAAAIATLAAYGTMMVASYLLGRKKYPIPYPLARMSVYIIAAVTFAGTSFYVFPGSLWVGVPLFLLFVLTLAYFEYKNLKKMLSP